MKESIIGKKYVPLDNSYDVNLSSCSSTPEHKRLYLAGRMGEMPKECIIASEPFEMLTSPKGFFPQKRVTMIVVEYENQSVAVMYHESRIIK